MNIIELTNKRKEIIDERFTPEQQNMLKDKFLESYLSVIKDCEEYINIRSLEKQNEAQELNLITTPLKYISNYKNASPNLYDTIELIIDLITHNGLPYACQNPLEQVKYNAEVLFSSWYQQNPDQSPFEILMGRDFAHVQYLSTVFDAVL